MSKEVVCRGLSSIVRPAQVGYSQIALCAASKSIRELPGLMQPMIMHEMSRVEGVYVNPVNPAATAGSLVLPVIAARPLALQILLAVLYIPEHTQLHDQLDSADLHATDLNPSSCCNCLDGFLSEMLQLGYTIFQRPMIIVPKDELLWLLPCAEQTALRLNRTVLEDDLGKPMSGLIECRWASSQRTLAAQERTKPRSIAGKCGSVVQPKHT